MRFSSCAFPVRKAAPSSAASSPERATVYRDPDGSRSLQEDPPVAARNQRGDVRERTRQTEAAGIDQVVRLPLRIELLLVGAQPLEVVEAGAVLVEESAKLVPERRDRRSLAD